MPPVVLGCRDAFAQPQSYKELLFVRIGLGALHRIGRLDVFARGLGVSPARGAIEGMRIGAEPDIRFAPPVLQVVQRFETGSGEIGDLVARDAGALEVLGGALVE